MKRLVGRVTSGVAVLAALSASAGLRPEKGCFLDPIMPHGLNETYAHGEADVAGEIAELKRIHAKTGIRRFVLHAPGHGVRVTGKSGRETYERIGDALEKIQAGVKDDGILVGYNVMPTIKCGCNHGFTHVTDIDGKEGPVAACPLDPDFRAYLVGNVAEVAKRAKPFKIMLEDDFQLRNHNGIKKGVFANCFCKRHLDDFAKRAGRACTREELKRLFALDTSEGQRFRDLWWEASCQSMELIAREIEQAVHAVSPETVIAYSSTEPCNDAGSAPDRIERALAGPGRRPMMRFTGACYGHDVPRDFAVTPLSTMYGREHCGEDYVFLYEGDPCPHRTFYASAVRMEGLLTYVLFCGVDTIHFWGAPTYPHGFEEEPAYLDMFAAKHRKMEAVRDLANESRLVGPWLTEVDWRKERVRVAGDRDGFDCSWARVFGEWGFPFHTKADRVTAVKGYLAFKAMTRAEIEKILSGPVLLDGSAATWLFEHGYGADLGCTVAHPTAGVDFTRDVVADLPELVDLRQRSQPCAYHQSYGNDGSPVAIVKEGPDAKVWSRFCLTDGTYSSASVLTYANARGGRVVILAPELEGSDTSNVFNPTKREIVRRALEWAGADLPAAVLDRCNVTLLAREANDGAALYLDVTSVSCDPWDSMRLAVTTRFAGGAVSLLGDDGAWRPADVLWNGRELTLKSAFRVYSPVIVRIAKPAPEEKPLRVLYWNFQNGMWDGQGENYERFVNWVRSYDPDVCVWNEGLSNFKTGTGEWQGNPPDAYLPAHLGELAARYGHVHTAVGSMRHFFPQLVTSKYPIECVRLIEGSSSNRVVKLGAGWFRVAAPGRDVNFVTLHHWPQTYAPNIPETEHAASTAAHGGDRHRVVEMEEILAATVGTNRAMKGDWVMVGDFNSLSRVDAGLYSLPADSPLYWVHDLIRAKTDYVDILARLCPRECERVTHAKGTRIDYAYLSPALVPSVKEARVVRDAYTKQTPHAIAGFYRPSDHLPILLDFAF